LQFLYAGHGEVAFKAAGWEGCEANTRFCNKVVEHIHNGREVDLIKALPSIA